MDTTLSNHASVEPSATQRRYVFIPIWIFFLNLARHVMGALKHQFDGHPVLRRMTWLKPSAPAAAP
jgi:hypothetical protein